MPPENICDKCGYKSSSDRFWFWSMMGVVCNNCNTEYAVFRGIVADALLCIGGHIKIERSRVSV